MQKIKKLFSCGGFVLLIFSAFCTEDIPVKRPVKMVSAYREKITIDGRLDEKIWQKGQWLTLGHCPDKKYRPYVQNVFDKGVQEKTFFKLAMDETYLYVGVKLIDSDIVAECNKDQEFLYRFGDVVEIFLKSEKVLYYWEIYVAANNRKTAFFYPSQGRFGLQSNFSKVFPFQKFKSQVYHKGTLNDYSDKDEYWSVEMAIPLAELEAKGVKFTEENKWTFLIYRPNYSYYLPWMEPTMFPNIAWNCHAFENYAPLLFPKNRKK